MPGTIGTAMPAACARSRKRPAGAGVELRLQVIEIVAWAARRGMGFRIGGDADLEIGHPLQASHQIGGIGITTRMRRIAAVCSTRRVAAQRHDMADASLPVVAGDGVDFLAGGGNTGQMRRRLQHCFLADAADRRMGALAGRAAGSVSNRDKARPQRLDALDHGPEPLVHVRRLRREELEGDARRAGVEIADRVGREQAARRRAGQTQRIVVHPCSTLSAKATGSGTAAG